MSLLIHYNAQERCSTFIKKKTFITGLVMLCSILSFSFIAPLFIQDYEKTTLTSILVAPCKAFPFGTDALGRCLFAKTVQGLRLSLFISLTSTIIMTVSATFASGCAVLLGPRIDFIMMRIFDIFYALPKMPILILLGLILPRGYGALIFSMSILNWVIIAKVVHGQFLLIHNKEHVTIARNMGGSIFYIFRKHLVPNTTSTILTTFVFTIPKAMFIESYISLIGLGVKPPAVTLGSLIKNGITSVQYHPWLFFFPAIFTVMIPICCNLIGEGLKSMLHEVDDNE